MVADAETAEYASTHWVETAISRLKRMRADVPVEALIVGAALQLRYPASGVVIDSLPRDEPHSFRIGSSMFRVEPDPGPSSVERCQLDLAQGVRPILLTVRRNIERAKACAEIGGVDRAIAIFAIEDFVTQMALGMSVDLRTSTSDVLRMIADRVSKATAQSRAASRTPGS